MSDVDPSALIMVRKSRGVTQVALARESGFSQAWISKAEVGVVDIADGRAAALAAILGCSPGLLLAAPSDIRAGGIVHNRKKQSMPVKALGRITSRLRLSGIFGSRLLNLASARHADIFEYEASALFGPEEAAIATRDWLGIEHGPVDSVVNRLEDTGVVVARTDPRTSKLDALSSWAPDGRPCILLNAAAPGDRARFTLAHELGHLVLHRAVPSHPEAEADRFASEFLMPEQEIRTELEVKPMGLPLLGELKSRWGVSMAALLRRARDLGVVGDNDYRSHVIEMSRAGYRTSEPIDVPAEQPTLVWRELCSCIEGGVSWEDIERHTLATKHELEELFDDRG